ncbi:MAG TPA: glycosyltransferase [Candidatus Micrarchaeia archaeon]|nr:glycosyltransferase [Candidatus Micrarchaeia archaeon]
MKGYLTRTFPMLRKGTLTLFAQLLISGMNFVLSLLLARWLVASQYGAYTLAFAIFLVISSVHNSLLLEPMGVLGPALHGKSLSGYVGKLVRLHFALALVLAMAMAIGTAAVSRLPHFAGLSGALAGACLATPWVLFLWFARQAAYLEMRPDIAVKGGIAYAMAILLVIFGLHASGRVTPFGAFMALAVAGAVAGAVLLIWIRPKFLSSSTDASFVTIWKQHWVYGRWVLVTAVVYWVSGQAAYYFIAAAFLKMEDVGTISALQNLVAPLSQFLTALSLLLLPWASTQLADKGAATFQRAIRGITLLFTVAGLAYFILVVEFGRQLTEVLYRGKYAQSVALIPMLALSQLLMAVSQGPVIGLRAMQRPSRVFVGYSVAAVFSVLVGLVLTKHWGARGNVTGMAASSCCFLLTTAYCYWSERKSQGSGVVARNVDGSTARVAWLLPSMDRGSCWQPLFKEFTREIPHTRVFTGLWNGYLRGYEDAFQLRLVPGYRFVTLKKGSNSYARGFFWVPMRIIPELYKFRPNVIFASAFSLWTLYALVFKALTGARVIILWEGNSPSTDYRDSRFRLKLRKLMARFADGGVSNMRAGVTYLQEVIGMSHPKLLHHPYEVPDPSVLSSAAATVELEFVRRPAFLSIGSLIARKGWSSLIEAASLLVKRGLESFSIIFVGDGEQAEEMKALVTSRGLERFVHLAGKIAYQNLGSYYRAADVFVFPTHEDTWGLVLLEAMAFGKPVLCSTRAGSRELVSHAENGFVFDSEKPAELADYMAQFILDPSLVTRFGARAAEAIAPFTPARAAKVLAGLAKGTIQPLQDLAEAASPFQQAGTIPELTSD